MKYLILLLALFVSSVFADANTPTSKAVCGQVYGYEVCVWGDSPGFDDEYGIRAVYKSGNDWVFLAHPSHFINNMNTKTSTDYYFQTFVDTINTAIESNLKPIGAAEPLSGVARVQWLVSRLSFSNNQLVYSPQ